MVKLHENKNKSNEWRHKQLNTDADFVENIEGTCPLEAPKSRLQAVRTADGYAPSSAD